MVRIIIALLLPFMVFFTIGRPVSGIICLILQLTLVGWPIVAIWAVWATLNYQTDKKIENALNDR